MKESFPTNETIAAISSAIAVGQGGIAVIRISGKNAIKSVQQSFIAKTKPDWETHKIFYGFIQDYQTEKIIDEVLILVMKAPNSFTGEDIVEVQCHGGIIIAKKILKILISKKGLREALPGEFSQRALLNGRIDLSQAESINQIINSKCEKAAELAVNGLTGKIKGEMHSIRKKLIKQLCELEARVDFEDEMEDLNIKKFTKECNNITLEINHIIESSRRLNYIHHGLNIALIGRPNVGKSSLLNQLSRAEKAIVTDIPGTTRDTIEVNIILEKMPIKLIDTAGIRETNNEIENLGVSRSRDCINNSDLVLFLFDLSSGWLKEDQVIFDSIPKNKEILIVGNKIDIIKNEHTNRSKKLNKKSINISAINGTGEKELISEIINLYNSLETKDIEIYMNNRQQQLLIRCRDHLNTVHNLIKDNYPIDLYSIEIREAISCLAEITGETLEQELLDNIFSQFCIGK
tara:strand:+ start:23406 stop:24791 length:1386 start_codon:yes stop_codon:yes gene_type:complete